VKKLVAMLLLSVIVLAACQTVPPSPTPITAPGIVEKASSSMDKVTSFHFVLTHEGGTTPILSGVEMKRAEGDLARPDKLKAAIGATAMGMAVDINLVTVGDQTFMTNPLNGKWEPVSSQFKALTIFNPDTGMKALLKAMTGLAKMEDDQVDGRPCYRIQGKIPASALQAFTISSSEGATVDGEVWVDTGSFLVRQVRLTGKITNSEAAGIARTLKLSGFDEKTEIALPK
jgi:hypothetical protein